MKLKIKPTKRDYIILGILIPMLFLVQRCYFPIIDYPELRGKTLSAQKDFTNEVLEKFPLGSNETEVIKELTKGKFKIWPPHAFSKKDEEYNGGASYKIYPGLPHPCSYEWRILWKSEEGKIIKFGTLRGSTCL